jgi:hypothetical protein
VTTPDTPEHQSIEEEAFRVFMAGRWRSLGIAGERELDLCDRLARAAADRRAVPDALLWQAKRVWDDHKDRITQEWAEKLNAATDTDTQCTTCPACGCPGMD